VAAPPLQRHFTRIDAFTGHRRQARGEAFVLPVPQSAVTRREHRDRDGAPLHDHAPADPCID
jgi:hypothetical protein